MNMQHSKDLKPSGKSKKIVQTPHNVSSNMHYVLLYIKKITSILEMLREILFLD